MCEQHQIVALATARRSILPGEIAAPTDAEHAAQALDGELLFRLIYERKSYRLPSLAKKAVAFFRMSLSCQRMAFSRRSRSNASVASSVRSLSGKSISRSRRRPIHRVSVDSPTPRFSASSRRVRPPVSSYRTASSSNAFVNAFCWVIEFIFHRRKTLHLTEASLGWSCRLISKVSRE